MTQTALVIVQHEQGALSPSTYAAVTAARQMAQAVHMLLAGQDASALAIQAAAIVGVEKVLHADAPHYAIMLAEEIAPLVAGLAESYSHIVTAATTTGKDILPRIAALCDVQQVSDIIEVSAPDCFRRPIYAGNAIETVRSLGTRHVVSVRPTCFDKATSSGGAGVVESIPPAPPAGLSTLVEMRASASERPELTAARVVVSGGRGVGSAENFALINALADKLGAAVGASRAAVDAGYVPNDYQVGQTGKIVAPELYIAVGISGAIQHLAGMKDSKVIVAINKDENAPIFEIADYGLVGDLFEVVPQLTERL